MKEDVEERDLSPKQKRYRIAALSAFPVFLVLITVPVIIFRDSLQMFSSTDAFIQWVRTSQLVAPLLYAAAQFVQVVIFIIPGEIVQVAGGYLFGFWGGLFYSAVGIMAGAAFNFFIGRKLGRPFVIALLGKKRVAGFEHFIESRKGKTVFFILFLIPGIPKDILCYIAPLSRMTYVSFLQIFLLGRLPALTGSIAMGSLAAEGQWTAAIVIAVIATVLFLAGLLYHKRILAWLEEKA